MEETAYAQPKPKTAKEPGLDAALRRLRDDLKKIPKNRELEKYAMGAQSEDSTAFTALGWAYRRGIAVPVDQEQAHIWYRLGAVRGNLEAELALGWIGFAGEGVQRSSGEAGVWYGSSKDRETLHELEK
jgi:TPR repeat protein